MHHCPDCGAVCYCDCDDTDYGDFIPPYCDHECNDDDFEYDDEEYEDDNA